MPSEVEQHFEAAKAAALGAALGYRSELKFQIDLLLNAAMPHLRAIIEQDTIDDDVFTLVDESFGWPGGSAREVGNIFMAYGAVLIKRREETRNATTN